MCYGAASLVLTSSTANKYLWKTGNPADTNKTLTVTGVGPFVVQVSNANGCINTSDTAKVDAKSTCDKPTTLTTASITTTSAVLKWNAIPCSIGYIVQIREVGTTIWSSYGVTANIKAITGLFPDKMYEWRVQTKCKLTPVTISGYGAVVNFATPNSLVRSTLFTKGFIEASSLLGSSFKAKCVSQETLAVFEDKPAAYK